MTDPFTVNDRRGRFVVGQSVDDAKKMTRDANDLMRKNFGDTNPYTQAFSRNQTPDAVLQEMRLNRRVSAMKKRATPGGYGMGGIDGGNFGGGSNVSFATGRPRDPLFYWRENNLPYDITKDSELKKIRAFCSLLYLTHPIIASCIDIFTKFPLQGMEIRCNKDEQIEEFYNNLFFDELDYRNYIVDISHQRWLAGEAWPLGSFNETLGVWEDDELLNPDDVEVERSALVKDPRFLIRLPETLRKVLQERSPRWEYNSLIKNYPELQSYAAEDSLMPVSNMLLKQVKFKCVVGSTPIMTPHGVREAQDLVVGDQVIAWDVENNKSVVGEVSHQGINPAEPIYWISTRWGRRIGVTAEHPFLTDRGWVNAEDLATGFQVRVGSGFGDVIEGVDNDIARFLGIMAGDGSCGSGSSRTIKFHNIDPELLAWMSTFVRAYGCELRPERGSVKDWVISQGAEATKSSPNQIRKLLKDHEMFGKNCYTKRVPSSIWKGGHTAWVSFLVGYFDTDGYYSPQRDLIWTSVNQELLTDCQTMLAGLSVHSRIQYVRQTNSYRLIVKKSLVRSLVEVGFAPLVTYKHPRELDHKNRRLSWNAVQDIRIRLSRGEKLAPLATQYGVTMTTVSNIRNNKFYSAPVTDLWDEVTEIVVGEPESTMALSIAGEHTHITAGLVTHNSDTFHKRGIPILMRAFRSVVQEEMLNAALDAIADRLYTPLILVKLGASASDLGTEVPWIPTQDDLETFEESMDAALAGDFRVLVNHFATDITSVFGRENMPDLTGDFERITDKILQVFGISQTMLNGGQAGETYAADALNRDMMATLLTDHQLHLKDFFHDRARIVAEAQEHYDFEVRGGIRYVKMEEVLKIDEESGEETIVEQPKLLVPTLEFETLTLTDKNTERQFREMLVQAGVPIPMKSRILGMGLDFDDMLSEKEDEQVLLAVAEQQTRRETYKALRDQRLPIPEDLVSDFRPVAKQPGTPLNPAQDAALPLLGALPQDLPALAPTMEDQQGQDEQDDPGPQDQDGPSNVIMMPVQTPQEGDQRPPESDEQRANMPKPANRTYPSQKVSKTAQVAYDRRVRGQIKTATANHYEAPDNSIEDPDKPEHWQPTGKFAAPKVVGMRQHVAIPESMKWREELDNEEGTA